MLHIDRGVRGHGKGDCPFFMSNNTNSDLLFLILSTLLLQNRIVDHLIRQIYNRGRMQPPSLEKRCLLRTEILQEIAAGAANHGLKTVDEAAAEDEATGAIPAL